MPQAAVAGRDDLVADDRELRRPGRPTPLIPRSCAGLPAPRFGCCWAVTPMPVFVPRDPEGILETANIAVLQRPHGARKDARASAAQTQDLPCPTHGQVVFCPVTQLDIASSDIRARIAAGHSADFLAPPAVLALAARHRLYRQSPAHGL